MKFDLEKTDLEKPGSGVAVGDVVKYVPDIAHALDIMPDGSLPWAFEKLDDTKSPPKPVPMTDHAVCNHLRYVGKGGLVPKNPKVTWRAVVRKVNDDGTADLDIDYPKYPGAVTHHYDRVPRAEQKEGEPLQPHTFG
jgi:hypothetical protein